MEPIWTGLAATSFALLLVATLLLGYANSRVVRLADVVRAFAIIRQELPARLVLVGDGPDREHEHPHEPTDPNPRAGGVR